MVNIESIIDAVIWVTTKQCRFCGIIVKSSKPEKHEEGCEAERVAQDLRSVVYVDIDQSAKPAIIVQLQKRKTHTMTPKAIAALQRAREIRAENFRKRRELEHERNDDHSSEHGR